MNNKPINMYRAQLVDVALLGVYKRKIIVDLPNLKKMCSRKTCFTQSLLRFLCRSITLNIGEKVEVNAIFNFDFEVCITRSQTLDSF